MGSRLAPALAAGGLALALCACVGPVGIAEPDVDDTTRRICEQLVADAPRTVLDVPRRDTTGTLSAAWGDPPITLTCGVPEPAAMETDKRCFEVNGVGWFAQEGDGGWIFTTIGRAVNVRVGVPTAYQPEADALVDLAAVMDAHNPEHTPCL